MTIDLVKVADLREARGLEKEKARGEVSRELAVVEKMVVRDLLDLKTLSTIHLLHSPTLVIVKIVSRREINFNKSNLAKGPLFKGPFLFFRNCELP